MAATIFPIFLILLVAETQVVESQSNQIITIKPDGSVDPSTSLLERNGTTYTLKGSISGTLEVQLSYITIDGAGYTLQGHKNVDERGLYLVGPDRSQAECKGILVKNLRICNYFEGIYVLGTSNNTITDCFFNNIGIHLIAGGFSDGDLITRNAFNDSGIFVDYNYGGQDVITENNFFGGSIFVDLADAPKVDRNYWSNYTAKYPTAKELGSSGIWDTPYVNDNLGGTNTSIDYHPLVNPVNLEIPGISNPTPTPTPTLTPSPTAQPTYTGTANPTSTHSPVIDYGAQVITAGPIVIIVLIVTLAVASVLLVYNYRRGRKHQ